MLVGDPVWGVGAGEGQGCLGYNALPVVDVAVALGELCNFIHEMAACIVFSRGRFRGVEGASSRDGFRRPPGTDVG